VHGKCNIKINYINITKGVIMSDFIEKLSNGDLESAREEIFAQLYAKTNAFMDEKRKEMALEVYSDNNEESEDDH